MSLNITEIHFSPSGRSKKVSDILVGELKGNIDHVDFMSKGKLEEKTLSKGDLLIVNLPVYAGRIPSICIDKLHSFKGDNTKAIAVVSYGNRDYDDALLELKNILEEQGFQIISAAAFITRHSIFSEVAASRPDEKDEGIIRDFINNSLKKFQENIITDLNIKGNIPYKEVKPSPLMPTGDDSCIECGDCVEICPVEAISMENPRETNKEKCINCTACIYNCPTGSRGYHSTVYKLAYTKFKFDNRKRKEPEIFL